MSLNLSGEITAIATAVLAVFAIVTAAFAFLAFRKQSREVDILIEQNDRDIRDRRRDQASRVFIWAEADSSDPKQVVIGLIIHIKNTSHRPVYDGLLRYRNPPRSAVVSPYLRVFEALLPDEQVDTGHGAAPVPAPQFWRDKSRLHASMSFRDAAGVYWELDTDGQLKEVPSGSGTPDPYIAP